MTENELYHHGILGMKWGVRRYQNKDGSLTPRGRKRLERLEGEAEKLRPKKKEEAAPPKSTAAARHPEVEDFDDEELKAKNNRLNMEKQYDSFFPQEKPRTPAPDPGIDTYKRSDASKLSNEEIQSRIERIKLEKQYTDLLPEERSKGKIFVEDMLKPAIYNQGKKLTEDVLSKGREVLGQYLGKKVESSLKNKLGIKEDRPDDPSTYRFEDMRKLSTKELKDRNERIDAENKYTKFFKDQAQSNDNSNAGGNDGGGNKSGKNKKEKTLTEPSRNEADSGESKKAESSTESTKKVETSNYDVAKDKNYHRVSTTESGRNSEYGIVAYRRNPVVDVMSRYEEAAVANTRPTPAQKKKVDPILKTYSEEDANAFIKDFNKKRTFASIKHSEMYTDELYHHGVKGQKWGVRRYQNADGTYTALGRQRQMSEVSRAKQMVTAPFRKGVSRYHLVKGRNDESTTKRTLKEGSMFNRAIRTEQYNITDNQHAARRADKRVAEYDKKILKALQRNTPDSEKVKKLQSQRNAQQMDRERLDRMIQAGKERSNALIKDALNKGYSVYMKDVNRFSRAKSDTDHSINIGVGGLYVPGSTSTGRHGMLTSRYTGLPIREDFLRTPTFLLPTERYRKYQVKKNPKKEIISKALRK